MNITYKALCVMVKYEINFAAQDLYLSRIRTVRTSNYSVKGKVKREKENEDSEKCS